VRIKKRKYDSEARFKRELAALLNRYSLESESMTPDYVVAEYLIGCLQAWNQAQKLRCAFFYSGKP